MNKLKLAGLVSMGSGWLTQDQLLLLISILLTVLGLIQDYLKNKKPTG